MFKFHVDSVKINLLDRATRSWILGSQQVFPDYSTPKSIPTFDFVIGFFYFLFFYYCLYLRYDIFYDIKYSSS